MGWEHFLLFVLFFLCAPYFRDYLFSSCVLDMSTVKFSIVITLLSKFVASCMYCVFVCFVKSRGSVDPKERALCIPKTS